MRIVIILALLAGLLAPPTTVSAHAAFVRSDPPPGAALAAAPERVTLVYTEPLDGELSKARLVDAGLNVVAEGPGEVDPGDERVLVLDLPPLPDGAYTVIWQARSAVDGHITSGVVTFTVGQVAEGAGASLLPPPGAPDPTSARPLPGDTLLRWLSYLMAALAAGSLAFGRLVWRPAYRAWEDPDVESDRLAARRLRRLAWLGAGGLALISLGFRLFQAWEVSRGPFQMSFGQAVLGLFEPLSSWPFWLRIALLALLAFLVNGLAGPGQGSPRRWEIAALTAAGVLLTFSLQSHSAALGSLPAVIGDWLHISAMAAWMGGLLPLFLLLRQAALPARLLVPRFSRLALISVGVLALSGLYSAWLHVRTIPALLETIYGMALSAKLILFALLILLGAVNLLVLSPRLRAASEKAASRLRLSIRAELALGILVLAATGLMTGVSPAYEAVQARQRMGYVGGATVQDTRIALWVAPGLAGENEIAVDVRGWEAGQSGHSHGAAEGGPQVLLRMQPADARLGEIQVEAQPVSDTRYTVKGSYLTIAGDWQVDVILRRPGANDIRHTFSVAVAPADANQ